MSCFSADGTYAKQFSSLNELTPPLDSYCTDTAKNHRDKNRSDQHLPSKLMIEFLLCDAAFINF